MPQFFRSLSVIIKKSVPSQLNCLSIYVCSSFSFGFERGMLDLIVLIFLIIGFLFTL